MPLTDATQSLVHRKSSHCETRILFLSHTALMHVKLCASQKASPTTWDIPIAASKSWPIITVRTTISSPQTVHSLSRICVGFPQPLIPFPSPFNRHHDEHSLCTFGMQSLHFRNAETLLCLTRSRFLVFASPLDSTQAERTCDPQCIQEGLDKQSCIPR